MATTVPTLPFFPGRSTPPDDYVPLADAFALALQPWGVAVNAVGQEAAASTAAAAASHGAAVLAAAASASSATMSENFAIQASQVGSAAIWVAGTDATGVGAISPSNYLLYRRKAPGGNTTTDPALDATNWAPGIPALPLTVNHTAASGTLVMGVENKLDGAVQQLWSVPTVGLTADSYFIVRVVNGRYDNMLDFGAALANNRLCNASTGYLKLDDAFACVTFRYIPGKGWRF